MNTSLFSRLLCGISMASIVVFPISLSAQEEVELGTKPEPVYAKSAELFGLLINDLSQEEFERHLKNMGMSPYPSYQADTANYSLGEKGILGIRQISVQYNNYNFVKRIELHGVVENVRKRSSLGNLLSKKYGPPMAGFVREGFGRAQWRFEDGTLVELHNTTYDVTVSYRDLIPKRKSVSGEINVQALKDSL
ncbi:uridine kinase [Marinomonas sp. MED121]|uniref:uridine kinase n=1 Tax=Marinomonas sp. MED121 TaxID=314277 RepID=UPI001039E66F|nr:uridine kinase [Marinomonas sp. MED121]